MSKVVRIHKPGGPEVLCVENIDLAAPGPGEVLIDQKAVGLNFIDCYHRSGLYPLAALPQTIGMEAAGIVEAVGAGVDTVKIGQRVCYGCDLGAYGEKRIINANRVIPLPDGIDFNTAAGMMLKGMTAHYLLRRTYKVQPGDTILFHAAAGGVGTIAVQWAKALGAIVIGTVGSEEKAAIAKAHGCDHTILYKDEDFVSRVKEITDGKGVAAVYDSVGASTFHGSLDCLRPLGTMVTYGNASGPVPAIEPGVLAAKGSLFLTRPSLVHYAAKREDLLWAASDLFDVVQSAKVKININQTYSLDDTAQAHRDLEARKTTGSTILLT